MIKSAIAIYRLPWSKSHFDVREDWYIDRQEVFLYHSDLSGEEAAEEAFHLTNAPEEILTEDQKAILAQNEFKGPSL